MNVTRDKVVLARIILCHKPAQDHPDTTKREANQKHCSESLCVGDLIRLLRDCEDVRCYAVNCVGVERCGTRETRDESRHGGRWQTSVGGGRDDLGGDRVVEAGAKHGRL